MNYFELFEIKETLLPDMRLIKTKFYELSRKYHPDFFTGAGEAEQQLALEKSALLNKAFKTFSNKQETIKYVLQLKGLLEEEEKFALPNDFLMEMMELNELVMDAKMENNRATFDELHKTIRNIEIDIYEPVKEIVEHSESHFPAKEELLQVKKYYYQQQYLQRMKSLLEK